MKKERFSSGTVYSTDHGRICPDCGQPAMNCLCQQQKAIVAKGDGVARVSLETKGRKGKGVTIISGLPLTPEGLAELAKRLKQRCGSGGTVKEGTIEIQGDHRQTVSEELERQGHRVKRVGGQ